MKIHRLVLPIFLAATCSAFAQVNVVGYVNRQMATGMNLVANQLNTPNNTLNNLFRSSSGLVPNGATFTKWDSVNNVYHPLSIYNLNSDSWSINYSLNLGEGGVLNSPTSWINTFAGEVIGYTNIVSDFGGGKWDPNYPDGLHLVACPMPVGSSISNMFAKVVGRAPEAGESVRVLDEATQSYFTGTFDGVAWDNNPNLGLASSAWFNLGPVVVPEPSSLALVGVAGLIAWRFRQRRD